MNGFAPPAAAIWREASAPDGRVYYYNTQTKATQWTKPAEMLSDTEKVSWKEYTHTDGRKYWHNPGTNETTWTMPDAVKQAQQGSAAPSLPSKPPTPFVSGGTQYDQPHGNRDESYQRPEARTAYTTTDSYEYTNPDDAEAAFFKLLRRNGVQPDWSYTEAMRVAIKDSAWRAIKDPKDRKAAFEKYVSEVRAQEKHRERDRAAKLRTDFYTMFRSHPDIQYHTRWKTAKQIIEGETISKSARTEDEAKAVFNEYRAELYKAHIDGEAEMRKSALDKMSGLLASLNLEPYTRWSEAQTLIKKDPAFQGDVAFKSLTKIDILKIFENHIKALERTFNDKRQKQKALKMRRERQNRDGFMELLRDLKAGGKLKAGTKWVDVHDLIEDDPRYVAMLGQSGSTPLDLFFDELESQEEKLRSTRYEAMDVLEERRFEMTSKTSYEEFSTVMKTDPRTGSMDGSTMRLVYEKLREKVLQRSDEDRHQQKRAVDALRSKIRRLEPPVRVSDSWDDVRPRLEKSEEYRALDSDETRKQAFDKFIKRLRDSEDDRRSSKGDRERRDRDHDRDRRPDRHTRHRTRTPEVDAYAADRKKAQADRERQYRRGSFGVSPPASADGRRGDKPRERERERDRDDRYEPPPRGADRYDGRSRGYDRERERDRLDRERGYVSRADPRESAGALDYGEETAPLSAVSVGSRRRRESTDDERHAKRHRGVTGSRSPKSNVTPAVKEPDVSYKSGSEEGEIEEE